MALKVAVYQITGHRRSRIICDAMISGIAKVGDTVVRLPTHTYKSPEYDVAVFYGLEGRLPKVLAEYPAAGKKAVYVDLGYWGRHAGGRWDGYHKVAVNSRHPTDYFQAFEHPEDRVRRFDIVLHPWRENGRHILLAGMGDKGARAEGFEPEQWERDTITAIRAVTDRPILYRPKPSWKSAKPIEGVDFSHRELDISTALVDCHAVVTHHSNVGVDALVGGIPVFSVEGVASVLGGRWLSEIDKPARPEGRRQFIADLAYTQFGIAEMRSGLPWRHLKNEGLVP